MGDGLKARAIILAGLAAGVLAGGCGGRSARTAAQEEAAQADVARTLSETAHRVAVAKTGAKVCREIAVGISERDWIRGTVVALDSPKIGVRIDNRGRFPQTLNGALLAPGLIVWDDASGWTPCG